MVWFEREFANGIAHVGQLEIRIQAAQLHQIFNRAHHRVGRRTVHVVEVDDVFNVDFQHCNDHALQIGPEYFRD